MFLLCYRIVHRLAFLLLGGGLALACAAQPLAVRTVPGLGHSDRGMARAAVEEIISTP